MQPIDDLAVPFLLMSAFRGLVDSVHADLEDAGFPGVRATHGFAMQAIRTGCSGVELAERLGVSKQAAGKTARALETMGFVTRRPSTTDQRERLLLPTPRGQEMLSLSARTFGHEIDQWRTRVGDADLAATMRTLREAPRSRRGRVDISDWV